MRMRYALSVLALGAAMCAGAETLTLGYAGGQYATSAPVGAGIGGEVEWLEMAIYLPPSTVETLKGNKIIGVNGGLQSASGIETVRCWIRPELESGENFAEFTLVPNQLNNIKTGANKLKFKQPWEIPSDYNGGLYVGFGHKLRDLNGRGISANTTPVENAFFLFRNDGEWYDMHEYGSACIDLVVEGDNLPASNVHVGRLDNPEYCFLADNSYASKLVINNFGTQEITSLDIECVFPNGEKFTETKSVKLPSNSLATIDVTLNPGEVGRGKGEVVYNITGVNGAKDADMTDNSLTGKVEVFSKSYPRYVLSEEFSTEMCGSCPPVVRMISGMLQKPEYKNVIQVVHHAGYRTDFLTEPWHEEYTKLYLGGTFAPGLSVDRSERSKNNIVFFSDDEKVVGELWSAHLATPAVIDVNVTANVDAADPDKLHVHVTGEKSCESPCESPVITVWVCESGIPQKNQTSGGKDYIHDHVSRAVGSADYWGDPVKFDGDKYSYDCAITLKPEWKRDNMSVVAFISNKGEKFSDRMVMNAGHLSFAEVGNAGVAAVADDAEVVAVELYDLSGRRVAADAKGMLIEQKVLSDGRKVAVKKVVR